MATEGGWRLVVFTWLGWRWRRDAAGDRCRASRRMCRRRRAGRDIGRGSRTWHGWRVVWGTELTVTQPLNRRCRHHLHTHTPTWASHPATPGSPPGIAVPALRSNTTVEPRASASSHLSSRRALLYVLLHSLHLSFSWQVFVVAESSAVLLVSIVDCVPHVQTGTTSPVLCPPCACVRALHLPTSSHPLLYHLYRSTTTILPSTAVVRLIVCVRVRVCMLRASVCERGAWWSQVPRVPTHSVWQRPRFV